MLCWFDPLMVGKSHVSLLDLWWENLGSGCMRGSLGPSCEIIHIPCWLIVEDRGLWGSKTWLFLTAFVVKEWHLCERRCSTKWWRSAMVTAPNMWGTLYTGHPHKGRVVTTCSHLNMSTRLAWLPGAAATELSTPVKPVNLVVIFPDVGLL